MKHYSNVFGLPYPGYKHPRERLSKTDRIVSRFLAARLAEKHRSQDYYAAKNAEEATDE